MDSSLQFWMSNNISKESEPLIPAGPFLSGTGEMPGSKGAQQRAADKERVWHWLEGAMAQELIKNKIK